MIKIDLPNPFTSAFQAIMDYLFGSPSDTLKILIKTMTSTSGVIDSWQPFRDTYSKMFGLAMVLSLIGIAVMSTRQIFGRRGAGVVALIDAFKLLMVGMFLPMFVMVGLTARSLLTRACITMAAGDAPSASWQAPFQSDISYGDILSGGILRLITQACGVLLNMMLLPFDILVWVWLILILLAYIFTKMLVPSSKLLRLTWSLLLTTLVAQPIIAIILVVGGKAIGVGRSDTDTRLQAIGVMGLTLVSVVVFFVILGGSFMVVTQIVESRLQVEGDVGIDGGVDIDDLNTEIIETRAAMNADGGEARVSPSRQAMRHGTDLAFNAATNAAANAGHPVVSGAVEVAHVYIKHRRED